MLNFIIPKKTNEASLAHYVAHHLVHWDCAIFLEETFAVITNYHPKYPVILSFVSFDKNEEILVWICG